MNFLREDTPIGALLERFMDLILVNVFFVLGCIPIVTIGASFSAMYDVCMKLALHESVKIPSAFFASFTHNLKRGTLLFLITVAAGAFLLVDFRCAVLWDTSFQFFVQIVILSVAYFYVAVASHAFPALVYFQEPVLTTIRHSFFLSMRNGVFTVFIMVMDLLPFLMFLLMPAIFLRALLIWLSFGFALLAYLNSLHLVRLFDPERVKTVEAEADALLDEENSR